jgi:hypothetical protein
MSLLSTKYFVLYTKTNSSVALFFGGGKGGLTCWKIIPHVRTTLSPLNYFAHDQQYRVDYPDGIREFFDRLVYA